MRLTAFFILLASPAAAHPGHVADLAGHSHWIALGALAAAGVLAAWLAGRKDDAAEDDESEQAQDEENQGDEARA